MSAPGERSTDQTAGRHWVEIRLLNRRGSPAINATVRLTAAGRTQPGEARSGSTNCLQSSFELPFGLGRAKRIESLEVIWRDGPSEVQRDLQPVDKLLTLRPRQTEE